MPQDWDYISCVIKSDNLDLLIETLQNHPSQLDLAFRYLDALRSNAEPEFEMECDLILGIGINICKAYNKCFCMAIEFGRIEFIKDLKKYFNKEINLDFQYMEDCTALMYAANRNHGQIVFSLLINDANPNIINKQGKTFWDYVKGRPKTEQALEKYRNYVQQIMSQHPIAGIPGINQLISEYAVAKKS